MPKMVSLRNVRMESTKGHVINFTAKEPKFVPLDVVAEASALGCVVMDGEDPLFYEDVTRAKVEFQGDVRKSMIYLAIKSLAEKNSARDFDGSGVPKEKVVSDSLGFDVVRSEVADVFQMYMQAKGDGVDYPLHPAANNIVRVLDADSKAELVELADEFGVPADKAKGLTIKDLRKLLLAKFNGVTAS